MEVRGSLFLPIIQSFFQGFGGTLLSGITRRTIFDREHMAGTYYISTYALSAVIMAIPMNLVSSLVIMTLFQLFIGWQANIILIWIPMFLVQMIGVGWGFTIGFATGDVNIAQAFGPAVIVPQIYLAGFYRPTENMAPWMKPLQWVSGMMYGYKCMLILEFGDDENHLNHQEFGTTAGPSMEKFFERPEIAAMPDQWRAPLKTGIQEWVSGHQKTATARVTQI